MPGTKSNNPFRPRTHRYALEPRQMYDGAALVEAAHHADPAEAAHDAGKFHSAAADQPGHAVQAEAKTPAPAAAPAPAATAAPSEAQPKEVYVVDESVANWQSIVAQLPKGSQVIVIDDNSSGMDQLANALRGEHDISAIHIISHGSSDSISLGTDTVTAANIDSFAHQLGDVGSTMTAGGDILLYGCDVSSKDTAMVTEMAKLTHADIASSTDETGAADRGGNWVLESSTGHIEARALSLNYDGLLEAPTVDTTAKSVTASEPSPLNAAGADHATLTGWTITDSGQVTVDVAVGDTGVGQLVDKSGQGQTVNGHLEFTGSAADASAWLNQLQFAAADKELGNTAAKTTITVTVKDVASSLTASKSLDVTITPSNDPVTVGDATQNVSEIDGGTGTVITKDTLVAVDPEVAAGTQTPTQIVYSVTAIPEYGYLTLNGNRLGVGSVFTQQDVIDGNVRYVHTATGADQDHDDSFSARVNDGATPLASSDTVKISLHVVPVNQAPTIGGTGDVYEGQPQNAAKTGNVGQYIVADSGGDPQDTTLTITITSLPTHGKLYFDGVEVTTAGLTFDYADRNKLTYSNDGTDGITQDTFGVSVTDLGGGTDTKATTTGTVKLNIVAVDDDPVFDTDHSSRDATVTAAGNGSDGAYTVVLTTDMLHVTDVDSPDSNLSFVVDQAGLTHGYLLLNHLHLQPGQVFTMDDIAKGRVEYVQVSGAEAGLTDTFNFQVVDNTTALRWNADGSTFTRIGGDYTSGLQSATLVTRQFTIHLAETTAGNGGDFDPPTTTVTHNDSDYAGTNPSGSSIGTVDEGGSIVLHGTGSDFSKDPGLSYTAEGVPPSQVVYTFLGFALDDGTTGGGTLQKQVNGQWVDIALYGTFTQADLNNGDVRFQHDGGENFHLAANFSVSAGVSVEKPDGTIVADTWTPTFNIYVTPVNDLPVVTGSSNTVIPEGGTAMITTGQLSITDPDDATSQDYLEGTATLPGSTKDNYADNNDATGDHALKFIVTSLPTGGRLEYSTDQGKTWNVVTLNQELDASIITGDPATTGLRFVSDGSEVRDTTFTVGAVDRWGGHSLSDGTVRVQMTNVNDAPQIAKDPTQADPQAADGSPNLIGGNAANEPLTVKEGGWGQITSDMLQAYDPDSTSVQVQYLITSAPAHGNIAYSTDGGQTFHILGAGSSFTQQDVAKGYIYYLNDGTESLGHTYTSTDNTPDDKFGFTISDGDKEQAGNSFWIYTAPTNDAPVVKAPTGPIDLDSAQPANNPVGGFSVSDPDLTKVTDGEQDYMEVVVRLLHSDGTAFSAAEYSEVTIGYATTSGLGVDTDKNGAGDYLVLRGTSAEVNAALAGLTVTFSTDRDAKYQVQVIADDRLRDANGNLTSGANGGAENQSTTPGTGTGTSTTPVDTTEYDWYTAAVPDKNGNISAASVVVRASSVNEPGVLTGPTAVTTKEDQATFIGGSFVVSDPESAAFDTAVTITLHVDFGTLGIGGAGTQTSINGVTISGDNSGDLVLTGKASDIQSLLNDTALGLTYTSAKDANQDQNGSADGDVTLKVTFDDSGSKIGSDTGNGSVSNNPAPLSIAITIDPVNDAPTVAAGSGTVYLDGSTAVGGFEVNDPDYTDGGGITDGETDFMEVTVRINDATGKPLASTAYTNIVITSDNASTSGVRVDDTFGGTDAALVIRGTRAEITAYLAGLRVSIGGSLANADQSYQVEVIADDRVRDVDTGALASSHDANGGPNANADNTDTADVPTVDVDPYGKIDSSLGQNVASNIRVVFPSSVNNPTVIGVTDSNVGTESSAGTYVLQHIALDDPDAGDSPISATITLPSGFLVNSLGGVAMSAGSHGTLNGTDYVVGTDAQGHSTITLTGSITDVEAALNTVGIKIPASSADKDNNALWNGTFQVQLSVNDQANHGSRPDQGTLDDDAAYNDGNYDGSVGDHYGYADNTQGSTDAALVTTRLINVTISSSLQVREEGLTPTGLAGSQASDGSWTFALGNGLDSVTFAGSAGTTLTLTAAQLGSLDSMSEASRTLDTPNGTLVITGYETNPDGTTTLTYHYTLTGAVQQPGVTSSNDTITVTTTDSEQSVNSGVIVVNIVNDTPTAYDDAAEVTEDSHQAATGNVVTDPGTTGKPDRLGADDPGASPVTGVGIGAGATPVAGNVGTLISGQYGHLTLNADGSYSYLANDDNAAVNALKDGETLKDSFTYQITDKDGDKATATLTITIKGHTDGAPTITAVDKNGTANGNVTVYEKGLVDGDDSQIQKSSIDFTAPDGLTSIWIGGTEVTLAQLQALGNGNTLNLVSTDGTLTLTGFTVKDSVGGVPTSGSVAYTFTLTHAPTVNTSALQENYTLSITDAGKAKVDGDDLGVLIIDDAPTAKDDAGTVTEDGPALSGDVVHGDANGGVADRIGADATASPVTGVAVGDTGTTATDNVGSALVGTYGTIVLNADGTYTYTLDNTNPTVNALKVNSQPLTETFTYTITDADGDTSTAKLVITIKGKTDGTPAVTVKDNNGAATGDATVYEAGLVDMPGGDVTSGKITVVAADGLSGVTFQWGTETITLSLDELTQIHQGTLRVGFGTSYGVLEINGFDTTTSVGGVATEGKISYTYTLSTAPSVSGDNVADTFHLTVVDASGAKSTVSDFVVNIVNDKPIANADAAEVTEDSGVNATGNVITGTGAHDVADRVGADGATVTGVSANLGGGSTSTGTVGSALDGQYGRLTLNSDGSYTYELDDSNPTVNALKDGSTPLKETFTYTITDGDGDTSQTTLVISIKGHTDGTLTVGPDGGNGTNGAGGAATVWEAGLTTDGPAADKSSVDGTLDIASPDGLSSVVIGGKTISASDLTDLHHGGSPITITTADGSTLLITDFTVIDSTGGAATKSTISYTYTLNGPRSQTGSDHENDTIALEVNDAGGGNATGSLVVTIMNDVPVAKGDTSDAYEDGAGASGNVIGTGGATAPGLGDVTDRPGADGGIHVTGVHAGDTGGTVTGSVGGSVVGQYGTLTLNSDGSYSYAVDNDNPAVNALKDGSQPLTDTYTYTITDADGDTSTATLTIRIHGNTDGAPTVTPADGNGAASGHATVYEPGLTPDGPAGESAAATGTIDLTAPDGLTSVKVGGTTLTVADLDAIHSGTPVTIHTPDGTLVLTDFVATTNAAGTITTGGTLSYTYTLDHAVGQSGAADTTDEIGLVVTDAGGADVHGTLVIDIVNDTPTANHDTGDVNEDGAPLTGNVVTGSTHGDVPDRVGADATASPVTGVQAGTAPGAVNGHVGVGVAGQYGTLTLNADGSYSYAVDNTNPVVNALKDGVTLTETYTYTITDADGDAATTTLTITIHGHTDGAPVIGAVDGNGSATGHATVHEGGLADHDGSQTTTGTLTVTAGDGLASVTIGGTTLTADQLGQLSGGHPVTIHTPDGTLVLTGFHATATNGSVPTAGTISYTYTLDHALTQNGPDSTDTIALTVVDRGGGTSNGTLVVDIANDVPVAHDDSATIVQDSGQTSTSGNVYVGSDRIGADGAAAGGPVTAVSSQNTGHAGVIGGGSAGAYGTLVLNPDGSYSYKLDVANPKVSSLDASRTLTEVFVYTITDADGDTSTATLTITIHGTTPPIQAKGDEIWPIGYDHTKRDIRQTWEPGLFVLPDGVAFSQKLLEDIEADRRVGENDFARDHSPLWDDFSPFAPAKLAEKNATDKHHHAHEKDHAKHTAQHHAPQASHEPPQVPVAIHVPPPASTPGGAPSLSARIAAMAKANHPEIAAVPTTQPRH